MLMENSSKIPPELKFMFEAIMDPQWIWADILKKLVANENEEKTHNT